MLSWIAVHSEHARIERDLEHRAQTALSAAGHDWASVAVSGRDALIVGTTDNPHDIPEVDHLVRHLWGVHRVIDRTKYIETAAKRTKETKEGTTAPQSGQALEATPASADAGAPTGEVEAPRTEASKTEPPKTEPPKSEPPKTEAKAEPPTRAPEASPAQAAPANSATTTAAPGGAVPAQNAEARAASAGVVPSEALAAKSDTTVAATGASDANTEAYPTAKVEAPAKTPAEPTVVAVTPPTPPMAPTPPTPPAPPQSAAAPQSPAPAEPLAPAQSAAPAPSAPAPQVDAARAATTATLPQPKDAAGGSCSEVANAIAAAPPLLFARSSAALGRRNRTALDQLAKAAVSCPAITLKVSGHADTSGLPQRNVQLAEKRAGAAVSYLVARGIDAGRLTAVGYGDSRPVAPNDSASNRAKNRRIEFEVSGYREGASAEQGASNGLSHR